MPICQRRSKYMGLYQITEDFGNNSFRIDLPDNLKSRGVHDVFHLSLLRIHIANNDRKFPGRRDNQIPEFGGSGREWAVDKITCHRGSHSNAEFEVQWTAGDRSWLPYDEVAHLKALTDYFEAIGVDGVEGLRERDDGGLSDDNPQVSLGHLAPHQASRQRTPGPRHRAPQTHPRHHASRPRNQNSRHNPPRTPQHSSRSTYPARPCQRYGRRDHRSPVRNLNCRGSTRHAQAKTPLNTSYCHHSPCLTSFENS